MREEEMSWFHCGKFGALFMARMGESAVRRCSECGRDPSPLLSQEPAKSGLPVQNLAAPAASSGPVPQGRPRGSARGSWVVLKVCFGWAAFMFLVVWAAKTVWPDEAPRPVSAAEGLSRQQQDDQRMLQAHLPDIAAVMGDFIQSSTASEKAQSVDRPLDLVGKMARFYQMNARTDFDMAKISIESKAVLHLPDGDVVETRWRHEDGRLYQAVFRQVDGQWRLDWEAFERYSDYPWALFLTEDGPAEGEFRLLVRERLAKEKSDTGQMSLVLYTPIRGRPDEVGAHSPEFIVDRESESGKLLSAAFAMEKKGETVFHSPLPSLDPEGMIRIRAKIRRVGAGVERQFFLDEVLACHWMTSSSTGLPAELPGK